MLRIANSFSVEANSSTHPDDIIVLQYTEAIEIH